MARGLRLPSGRTKAQEVSNDTVIGFNKFGKEAVRVTIEDRPTTETIGPLVVWRRRAKPQAAAGDSDVHRP